MRLDRSFVAGFAVAAALIAAPVPYGAAHAATITFETAPGGGGFAGPVTEDGFTYSRLSGALLVNGFGNPGRDMEGNAGFGGGVLSIVAAAGQPSTFSFAGLDYAALSSPVSGSRTLTVIGLLAGSTQGTESYVLANAGFYNWTAFTAAALAGKVIDELRITLAGSSSPVAWQAVDNIRLAAAPVPVPGTLVLLAAALGGLGIARRRSAAAR